MQCGVISHILTRDITETIKKIKIKQKKKKYVKGDWFQLLVKDLEFIKIEIIEKEISGRSKYVYK